MTKDTRYIILGYPRSGTTLLSRLLDAHPDVSCPPETHLFTAAARFLSEQDNVEGPPIGVLAGVNFLGVEAEDVLNPLRKMCFGFHERAAQGAPIWVEKTGVDIFHIDKLKLLLEGHAKFILLWRNPLDVIPSNVDLAEKMGAPLTDVWQDTRSWICPFEGLAQSWVQRSQDLRAFQDAIGEDCHALKYEDLTQDPASTLSELFRFMGAQGDATDVVSQAFTREPNIGLGDFRIDGMTEVRPPDPKAWRTRLPRMAAGRVVKIVAEEMEHLGYDVPKTPKRPSRETAVRQFTMAAQMKRNTPDGTS
ncbi:sulfotransferase [Octadecabacter sp. CECT 8868]|uniref:sulfotransferase family protein n=1 Tax=Octadecabacter algicola TaxID=2909342 RepID=UPI001F37E68D|nr:sulfotransferase [Octadecabacter algicola]MCF2906696.1 sulfotransferase [Octadecabacter algicola]